MLSCIMIIFFIKLIFKIHDDIVIHTQRCKSDVVLSYDLIQFFFMYSVVSS